MTEQEVDATCRVLLNVLTRAVPIPALEALSIAVKGARPEPKLDESAIVIDANVFLRIPAHRKSSDIMDHLVLVHQMPVVIPGQVIQEFWNNHLAATDSVYRKVSTKHADILREVGKFEDAGVANISKITEALEEFKESNEHVFDPEIIGKASSFLDRLPGKAMVPFFPRALLSDLALTRKKSKTPPGFRDEGDGDFLVWVDMLWGLSEAKLEGAQFANVILLTYDSKPDWVRGTMPHPILIAEAKAALEAEFYIWNLDKLSEEIAKI